MSGLKRAALLVSLVEQLHKNGSWCGETHIQKAAFFLQELMGVPLKLEFILYKHGPFSFDLGYEITSMRANEVLELRPSGSGTSVIPGKRSLLVKSFYPKTLKKFEEKIGFVAERLGKKRVVELERIATALYVTLQYKDLEGVNTRARRIIELKPHISLAEANDAVEFVDKMREELANQPLCSV